MILLRLDATVETVFSERVTAAMPLRAAKIMAGLAAARDGALTAPRFGDRTTGRGPRWQAVADLYHLAAKRLGYISEREGDLDGASPGERNAAGPQRSLF